MKKILIIILIIIFLSALGAGFYFYLKSLSNVQTIELGEEEPGVFNPADLSWQEIKPEGTFWSGRDAHSMVEFDNKLWVYGGIQGGEVKAGQTVYEQMIHKKDIWNSEDGINWQLASDNSALDERRSIGMINFKNKLLAMGGWMNTKYGGTQKDVLQSSDGINWKVLTSSAWPAREGHGVAVFKDKIWVIGGVDFLKRKTYNDVWQSSDGITWTQALSEAPFAKRYDHTLNVFDNKLWLIGGLDFGDKVMKDIWVSEDGITWQEVKDIPFSPRHGHVVLDYKGYLWVIGGWSEGIGALNDVWYSSDGYSWQKARKDAPFSGREDHAGIVFKDKIWITGGMAEEGNKWIWKNDIWIAD